MQNVLERPEQRVTTKNKPLTFAQIRMSVAMALEGRGKQKFIGVDGIEDRMSDAAMNYPTGGTIFAAIGEELSELGVPGNYKTIGGVMTGLGYTDKATAHSAAHAIGCNCHGSEITAEQAAARVRDLA